MFCFIRQLAAIFAVTLFVSGHASAQSKSRDVAIGLQAAITSIDPHFHNLSPNNSMSQHIFEPMINRSR